MRFGTIGLAPLGAVAPDVSAVAQTTPASPAITRTAVAATKLPTVVEVPLYFQGSSCDHSAGGAEQRLSGQRHSLSARGID